MVVILFFSEIGLFLFKFGFITNSKAPKIKPNFSGVTFNWIRRAHLNPGLLYFYLFSLEKAIKKFRGFEAALYVEKVGNFSNKYIQINLYTVFLRIVFAETILFEYPYVL